MTIIRSLRQFAEDEVSAFVDEKENPDEWYVLLGSKVTSYSVWNDEELPDDYEEIQEEMPPEDRDANPNADGYMQIGTGGWSSDAYDFDGGGDFVSEVQWGDKVDKRLLDLLIVHQSVLSEEAIEVHEEGRKQEVTEA